MSDTQRLFLALWPDDSLRATLARLIKKPLRACGGKPVPIENLHITLLFLGALDGSRRTCLTEGIRSVREQPFQLRLREWEYWPRPRVVSLVAEETPAPLLRLVDRLRKIGLDCGIKVERRAFIPHLTCLRKAGRAPKAPLARTVVWDIHRFVLARSWTLPEGARYEVVESWELGGK
ncbi:MAG: RNA 2',3'-cyclic phosphodiesterase [Gammaproteobacteria bacterium]